MDGVLKSVTVKLKPGREAPVKHGHPWIFSGAIASVEGEGSADAVAIAEVVSGDGEWLARGLWDRDLSLSVRLYTRSREQPLDRAWLDERIRRAVNLRLRLFGTRHDETNAYRLVYSESDGLSGLIVDRYADALCIQVGARSMAPWLDDVIEIVREATGITKIWVQAEPDAATRDKLIVTGPRLEETVRFRENGLEFEVAPSVQQKTGFYLDQRENRRRVAGYCEGRRVLSAFCYTGAFEVYAARAGAAEIIGIDRSAPALQQAQRHHEMNGTRVPSRYIEGDVAASLRKFRDEGRTFDVVILDPPRFVARRTQKEKGLRAYKDINLLALKLLTADGVLATFSCSGLVSMEEFKMMLGWAARDAGREVQILEPLTQPPDHPVLIGFPEGEYLKGLICRVK